MVMCTNRKEKSMQGRIGYYARRGSYEYRQAK